MKKALLCLMSVGIMLCFLGCNLEDRAISLTDSQRELSSPEEVYLSLENMPEVEALPPVTVHIKQIEDDAWSVSCSLNDILIQTYTNYIPPFDENVTFKYDYVYDKGYMPYYLYTPSTAIDSNQEFPLIVWLHGSGEKDIHEAAFRRAGLAKVMDNWSLSGFNAYVIMPQLALGYNKGAWNLPASRDYLKAMLDDFIATHNIDTDKMIICGHSLGGQGCLYIAHQMPEYFKACISFSPYSPGIDISEITMPVIGYSEAGLSMANTMQAQWGEDCMRYLPSGHGFIPRDSWNLDENNNNCSDVVEWIFKQFE